VNILEVKINSKSEILGSYWKLIPTAIAGIFLYWVIFLVIFVKIFQVIGLDLNRIYLVACTTIVLFIALYLFIRYLNNSYASYVLKFHNEKIRIGGISGWRLLDKEFPLSSLREISVGQSFSKLQNVALTIKTGSSRSAKDVITFQFDQEKPIEIHHFSRIFEQQSLIEFLCFLKNSGVTIEWVLVPKIGPSV
jgi:hypothetical protein